MEAEGGKAVGSTAELFPQRKPMTPAQIAAGIEVALAVQRRAVTLGKRPFAAALIGPNNDEILLTHQSVDQVNHAESSLARLAYKHYPKEFLWQCTLFSTWEPCGMCTATIYVRLRSPSVLAASFRVTTDRAHIDSGRISAVLFSQGATTSYMN